MQNVNVQLVEDRPTRVEASGERGAAIVEYVILLGVVSVMLTAVVGWAGGQFAAELDGAATAIAGEEEALGQCPTGWTLTADTQPKKSGRSVDRNNDGLICVKDLPGGGNGNSGNNRNVKDNNPG